MSADKTLAGGLRHELTKSLELMERDSADPVLHDPFFRSHSLQGRLPALSPAAAIPRPVGCDDPCVGGGNVRSEAAKHRRVAMSSGIHVGKFNRANISG